MKKKKVITMAGILIIVAAGIFAVVRAKKKENALSPAKQYAITVSVMKAEFNPVQLTQSYLAQTQNDKDVNLVSRVSARVEFLKRSGISVKKGEVIARFDNTSTESSKRSIEAQITAQKITLDNLVETHKRTLELLAVKGASKEQSETEDSKIASTKASIESLKQNLNDVKNGLTYSTIVSPVDGQISRTTVNVGDMVMPGQAVATISANSDFYLQVLVPTNLPVYGVVIDNKAYDAIPLNSTLNNLAQYKVYVDTKNMITGDRVEVDVITYKGSAIKLPFDAVLNREGVSYVLISEKNKAVATKINVIQTGEEGVVINNSELANKQIIVAKQDILLELLGGAPIKVKEE